MEFNTIPDNLQDWSLETIDSLIKLRDAESENLDFKEIPSNLAKHISAFANTTGGFLILGIAPVKDTINKTVSGYKKMGFQIGKEDEIGLEISNNAFLISPIPLYKIKHIEDGPVFYSVVKIENEISKKPFILKNKGQCFIRLDTASCPAPRSTIMNLFGVSIEYRKNIQNLKSACVLLKESLLWVTSYFEDIEIGYPLRPAPVDLTILKSSLLTTMDFVSERDLLGCKTKTTARLGITTVINTIEQLNAQLYVYNITESDKVKANALDMIFEDYRVLSEEIQLIPEFLDKVISKTTEFLANYQ